jgi:hypothetical protein
MTSRGPVQAKLDKTCWLRIFSASLHVCDTIEGLILVCYELLYKCLYKIDKRLVISIVLHLTTLSSASVMACLHGKAASYNLLEGIYANAVAQEVERLCVESCNGCQAGHPSQRQHDCQHDCQHVTRPQKRPLGPLFALAPRAFFMALWPDSLESYWWDASQPIGPQGRRKGPWGHFPHWPLGPFLWLCGPIL